MMTLFLCCRYERVFAPLAVIDLTEAEGAWVRSLIKWAEESETSSRCFLRLERKHGADSDSFFFLSLFVI